MNTAGRIEHKKALMAAVIRAGMAALLVMPALAQDQARSEGKTIQGALEELGAEVRLLRKTFERASARQSRVQIELDRYRIEHDLLILLSNRLEDVRTELAGTREALPQQLQQMESAEAQLKVATEPERRAELEAAIKRTQSGVDQHQQREAQLREKEARLATSVQAEEDRVEQYKRRLDAIVEQLEKEGNEKQ